MSCSNDEELNNIVNNDIDVYAAGSLNGNASYWKNSEQITLENDGFSNTYASGIFVTESNTYLLGSASVNQNENPEENNPNLFWENGVVTNLNLEFNEPDFEVFRINDFYVYNDDVYFVGTLKNLSNPSEFNLVYWKNGVKTVMLENIDGFCSSYIRVLNDEVYVFYSDNTINGVQGLIVNNTFNPISSVYGAAKMETNENEVYIYGQFPNSTNGYYYNFNTGIETTTPYFVNELDFDQNDVYTLALYSGGSFLEEILKNNIAYYQANEDFIIDSFEMYNGDLYLIERNFDGQQTLFANNIPLVTLDNADVLGNNFINSIYVFQN